MEAGADESATALAAGRVGMEYRLVRVDQVVGSLGEALVGVHHALETVNDLDQEAVEQDIRSCCVGRALAAVAHVVVQEVRVVVQVVVDQAEGRGEDHHNAAVVEDDTRSDRAAHKEDSLEHAEAAVAHAVAAEDEDAS